MHSSKGYSCITLTCGLFTTKVNKSIDAFHRKMVRKVLNIDGHERSATKTYTPKPKRDHGLTS